MDNNNLTLLMDYYELTMSQGYFNDNKHEQVAVFDMFFRSIPDGGGYAIFAGLESVVNYIENLKFDESDIKYLKSKNIFNYAFLDYLKNFKFT